MSKDIVIQEGGAGRQFTADKLRTSLVDGGTCLWVPEDEVKLGTKTITENGTYLAADDGVYGYSKVVVKGVGTASGKGADGNEYVSRQQDDGTLVTEALPSSIAVVAPPENAYGVWQDGQAIDKTGMAVKGYLADGTEWGDVPVSEVSLAPDHADFSQTAGSALRHCDDFGVGPWPQPLRAALGRLANANGDQVYEFDGGYIALLLSADGYKVSTILCSDKPGTVRSGRQIGTPWPIWDYIRVDAAYTYDGKTVYYNATDGSGLYWGDAPEGLNYWVEGSQLARAQAAWIILYGDVEQSANGQIITASWPRNGDGKTLEATFEILVAPGYGGDE